VNRLVPLVPDRRAPLGAANPLAKVAAAAILMAVLFASPGPITPAVVLVALLVTVPATGLRPGALAARTWPLLLAALSVGILNAVLAPGGASSTNVAAGLALGLRLLTIAFAGILALASSDPTDLADALQQQARLSPRLAVGALAALRLFPMLAAEWQVLRLARRARGVSAGWSPVAAARLGFGMLLALLVGAIRRATRLAIAMEARGFGSGPCRSVARRQRMGSGDWALIVGAVVVGTAAIAAGRLA